MNCSPTISTFNTLVNIKYPVALQVIVVVAFVPNKENEMRFDISALVCI